MIIFAVILMWSVLLFGAVHTYAYTVVNIGILIVACRHFIQWKNNSLTLVFPKTPINNMLLMGVFFIGLYIIPLPQFLIHLLSPESAMINQLSQSPMQCIENNIPLRFGTIALTDFSLRNAWVQYMVYVLFFLGLIQVLDTPKRLKQFSILLILMGAAQSLYGIMQTFGDVNYILWVPKAIFKNERDTSGTFINRNHFAALMTMLMLFAVAYSASLTGRKVTKKTKISAKKKLTRFLSRERQWNQQILIAVAAAVMGLGILFSASRGAMLAFFPGAIVLIMVLTARRTTRKQGLIMVVVCIIIAGFAIFAGEDRTIRRFSFFQENIKDRLRYTERSLELIKDYPLFGVGASNFECAFSKYQSPLDQQV
ncbi:MAG: O-antigen ligase family protein, partial [Candidatus Magnetomorum sp.]|nr:O-antigen ligase family protein [Candidatus Magnetomorum sp.]